MPEKKSKKLVYILLGVIILLELLWTGYVFIFEKDGHHSDEIWSYGLANSYYQPLIYQQADIPIDDGEEKYYINLHEWVGGDTFRDYVTVQEGERFAYGSVWSNQTYDHHPPLYYMLLHTVCSFFPDKFSLGFGFFLNCIFLIVTQIFLFKTARYIMKDDRLALITCVFYGSAHAALFTFTFIRQYSLLTMLTIMLVYFTARLYSERDLKKALAPILIISFLMFMTHYYGIVLAGALTACMCIYMLAAKQITRMLIYGFSMMGCLGLFFAVYPAALTQMFSYVPLHESSFSVSGSFTELLDLITQMQLGASAVFLFFAVIAAVLIAVLLNFISEKEKKARCLRILIPSGAAGLIPLMIVVMTLVLIFAVIRNTDTSIMGEYSVRYLFCIFPGICIAAVTFITKLVRMIPRLSRYALPAVGIISAAAVIKINVFGDISAFKFRNYPRDINTAGMTAGKNCVVILQEDQVWTMTCYPDSLSGADKVFVTTEKSLKDDLPKILDSGIKPDYILGAGIPAAPGEEERFADMGYKPDSTGICEADPEDIQRLFAGRSRTLEGHINILNGYAAVYRLE